MSTVDYFNMFERFNKIHRFNMVLPMRVLACKVLNNANISSEKRQLIRAIVATLTYENMIKQLKIIYDRSANSVNSNDNFDSNCETVYYANKPLDYSHLGPKDGYRSNHCSNSHNPNKSFSKQFIQQPGTHRENYDKWGRNFFFFFG